MRRVVPTAEPADAVHLGLESHDGELDGVAGDGLAVHADGVGMQRRHGRKRVTRAAQAAGSADPIHVATEVLQHSQPPDEPVRTRANLVHDLNNSDCPAVACIGSCLTQGVPFHQAHTRREG